MEPDAARELEAEIELVRRVGLGDQRSFAALYDRFAMVLFSTAFRVLKNQEAAEDVLQEVFVQIWKKAPLYDSTRGRPLTWALTLTRNKAIDVLRSMQRRSCLQSDVQQDVQSFEHSQDRSFFDSVTSAETSKLVRDTILQLPNQQREAIELAFFSSMTHTEIAERLKVPLGTIKARIRRGMMVLRELIEPRL